MKALINGSATISCVENNQLAIERVYEMLSPLEKEYPDFEHWFYATIVPGLRVGSRKIFVASFSDEIAGVLILKDANEKKICTLRVLPEYRRMGVGRQLMQRAVQILNIDRPLITVSDMHLDEFKPLFAEFGFSFTAAYIDYYRQGSIEYAYNGYLV